jgi:hypothetical protein
MSNDTILVILSVIVLADLAFWVWRCSRHHRKTNFKLKRSNMWPAVRRKHLEMEPTCQGCGTKKELNVHHIRPFHLHPALELDHKNLITLCEYHRCHLVFGHLCSWDSYNVNVRADAKAYLAKVQNRP